MRSNKFKTRKINKNHYKLTFGGKYLGNLIRDVDGYFYYDPILERGTWASWSLKAIADMLDNLNKDWDEQINKYFKMKEDEKNNS